MIFVKRGKEPLVLKKNKAKWLLEYLTALQDYKLNPKKKNKEVVGSKENKYKQVEVKNALRTMFADKCAYCESYIGHVSYGHIEHFKPKAKYHKQCFNWNNFLLACEMCNGSQYKSSKFPQKKENGPLVNPTRDNPETYFSFEYDPLTGTANVIGKNVRGNTTEKILGLNRMELIRHRSRIVRRIVYVAIKASKGDVDALQEMKSYINADEEYSAFSIELFAKFNLDR